MDKEILITPNSIARGNYSIGEKENKLFLKLLYCIQKDNKNYLITKKKNEILNDEELKKWNELCSIETLNARISKQQIIELFKNRNDRTPEGLKDILGALKSCDISFNTALRDGTRAQMIAPLISHYYIEDDTDDYLIVVPAKLYKYLFDLGLGHSQNALQVLYSLKGLYSQRLYLIFRSWTGSKRDIEFKVSDIRDMLQLGNKNKSFNSLETNVLKRSIDEINRTGVMEIKIKDKIKVGRSVDTVVFSVVDNEPRNYLTNNIIPIDNESIEWVGGIKVSKKSLIPALECEYGELDLESPIVLGILKKAYQTTLAKDKNGELHLTPKNLGLFITIANGDFLTNELGLF